VVSFVAENLGQVPLKVYKRVSDEERKYLSDHPVQVMLGEPNPELSAYEFIRDFSTDLEVFDCAFYQIHTVKGALFVTRLWPDAVTVKESGPLGPEVFEVQRLDGSRDELDRGEVLYLHGYGGDRGISPIETLRRILSEDEAAGNYREGMYRNGMRNAGVIRRPVEAPDWSETARGRFLDQLTDRHVGAASSGRPLLLEEGMEWSSDQISMRSEEYIASRELTTRTVANAYRVSPQILGLEPAPYSSITEYNRQLYQNALAPRLTFISQGIERQLLSKQERAKGKLYVEFSLEAKLRGSFAEQAAIGHIAVGQPWMTVDEWRGIMDLAPLEEEAATSAFASVGLPALVAAGIVSAAWAAEQVGAPSEGLPTVPMVTDPITGQQTPVGGSPGPDAGLPGVVDQPAPSEDPGALDTPKTAKASAERGIVKRRKAYAHQIEETVAATLDRLAKTAKSHPARVKAARFEAEIASDLRPVLERVVVAEGTRKAAQLGADFDPAFVQNYLDAGSKAIGQAAAVEAEKSVARHRDATDDGAALKLSLAGIATRLGVTNASSLVSFAREAAGKQAGITSKTWVVTSDNSRHPDWDGMTAELGKEFDNGLLYPGDPRGEAFDTSFCLCVLDIG